MVIHDVEQGSDIWLGLRKGRMTASHAQAIGANGAGLKTYIHEVVAEYLSCGEVEQFTNKHIERGNELEPIARNIYELSTGNKVEEVGFIEHSDYVGCSPDGLIGEDGGLEIKCPADKTYLYLLLNKKIKSDYDWQIQMNLLITGREWWDYMAYNPNFKQDKVIIRVYPDKAKHEKLLDGFKEGETLIKNILERIKLC